MKNENNKNWNSINEFVLNLIKLYKENNKNLDIIMQNNPYYSREIIELKEYEINKQLDSGQVSTLKERISEIQNKLKNESNNYIVDDLINNLDKLELAINKFWFKFSIKFKKNDEILKYWRNEYWVCYKKQFLQMKTKQYTNKKLDINKINNTIQNETLIIPISNRNSIS